jgi:RNA polymerase sigma-70 factor (ECF subfamily)
MAEATPNGETEAVVVLKAIAGDDAAFHELVLRRQRWLRSVLRRLTNDATLADDLCQEALLKAWRRISDLQDHRAFAAWLRRIAVRVWADRARRQRLDFESVDPDTIENAPATGGVQTADYRLDLQAAISSLRPGPRACVVLFYGEGMSHSEIAAATGMTVGVVKSHIARATKRLRSKLVEWSYG